MSASLSDTFANLTHIGKVKRKPMRNEISALRSRANKLAKDDKQKAILAMLTEARRIVDTAASTNAERRAARDNCRTKLNTIQTKLSELEGAPPPPPKAARPVKPQATKEELRRAEQLQQEVEKLKQEIQAQFERKADQPYIDLQTVPKMQLFTRFSLLGEADGISLEIKKQNGVPEKNDFKGDIDILRGKLQEVRNYVQKVRGEVTKGELLIAKGRALAGKLGPTMGAEAVNSELVVKIKALDASLHPDLGVILPTAIDRLMGELTAEIKDASSDITLYGQRSKSVVDDTAKGANALKTFDGHLIDDQLKTLLPLAEATESPIYHTLSTRVLATRIKVANLEPAYLDPDALARDILTDIAREKALMEKQIRDLFDVVNAKLTTVRKTMAGLKTKPEPVLVVGKGSQPLFQADWNEITAIMGSITRMMPASADKAMALQSMANLVAVEPLLEAAAERVEALRQKYDPADSENLLHVETRLAKLQLDWAQVSGSDQPLPKYYKEDFKKLGNDYDKFMKALPTSKAKTISDGLKKFEDALAAKRKVADDLQKYISETFEPEARQYYQLYNIAGIERSIPSPNAIETALQALTAEFEKLPPTKATLVTLLEAVKKAFANIKSTGDLARAAGKSHAEEKDKKEKKKIADRATKAPLRDRLRGLEDQLALAKDEVEAVGGDKAVIKQIKRMLDQASAEVEAPKETEATRSMDRIQNHIDMVLAHPEGEAARRRDELPDLYKSWAGIRNMAAKHLATVKEKVLSHQPDPATKKAVERLGRRIDSYGKEFARGHGDLRHLIGTLSDDKQPDQARRKARESALAAIANLQRAMQAHPLSTLFAQSPFPEARAVPGRLLAGLEQLRFTILTCVE